MSEHSSNPRDRRRQRTRREILRAAADVFATKGFYEASIQEIAERADFSTGSLYNYFENKEALFDDLLQDVFESFTSRLQLPDAEHPLPERVEHMVRTLFGFGDEFENHFRLFVLLHWSGNLGLGRKVDAQTLPHRRMFSELLASFIEDGVRRGELPAQDASDSAVLVLGTLIGFAFRWFHGEGRTHLVDETAPAVALILRGLGAHATRVSPARKG